MLFFSDELYCIYVVTAPQIRKSQYYVTNMIF